MNLPVQPPSAASRLGMVSQLLRRQPAAPVTPPAAPPFQAGDRLQLQAPVQLFRSSPAVPVSLPGLAPVPALSVPVNGQPAAQLQALGQKYGVARQAGESLRQYESKVIKAIVRHKAREHGIPERIALGIAANESGFRMWKDTGSAEVLQGRNVRDGVLKSTDWGVMQINDKAHPRAFPRVQNDLEYNIDYGLSYLARQRSRIQGSLGLGLGDWDRTVASYNLGHDPKTARALSIAQRYVGKVTQRAAQV